MDITPFLDALRQDLANAADAAGPEGRAAADRMLLALDPAVRLMLMEACAQAAAEITADLPAGQIEVRLRGRDPEFVVDVPVHAPAAPLLNDADPEPDDDTIARITLRIPESVKARAEESAAKSGASLNSWVVSVLRSATASRAVNVDIDLSSIPFFDERPSSGRSTGRRMSGWV